MSHKPKKTFQSIPVTPPEPAKATPPAEEPAKLVATATIETPPEPAKEPSLEDMVQQLPEGIREKALEQLKKLTVQASRNEQAKAFSEFNKELDTALPKFLSELATKHSVSLSGRTIKCSFPANEKAKSSNVPIGSKGGGNGNGTGFPTQWGKATLRKKGSDDKTHDSPSKLAAALGLQVEGMRDMVDVFENPKERGTKKELPKIYEVDAVKGDHFIVTIKS